MILTSFAQAFTGPIEKLIPRLPGALLTFVVGFIVIQFLLVIIGLLLDALRTTKALHQILHSTAGVILWGGVIALTLQSLGLTQIALAVSGSFAIIGIGVASGANKLVSDVVAGLFLAKNRNFKIGQRIKIDTVEGRIHSLDVRKVRVLSDDGKLSIIPNAKFDELIWQILPDEDKDQSVKPKS